MVSWVKATYSFYLNPNGNEQAKKKKKKKKTPRKCPSSFLQRRTVAWQKINFWKSQTWSRRVLWLLFSCSVVSNSFSTPWTVAQQAPLSMGFSRQEYWSGLPCPPPGDLPDSGIEPGSPALQADSLMSEPPGKPSDVSWLPYWWPWDDL